jgi:hypothetical protein
MSALTLEQIAQCDALERRSEVAQDSPQVIVITRPWAVPSARQQFLLRLEQRAHLLGEDAWLLQRAVRAGKRLIRLSNPGVFVYVRHGRNAWQFTPGAFLNPSGWTRIPAPPFLPAGVLDSYKATYNES